MNHELQPTRSHDHPGAPGSGGGHHADIIDLTLTEPIEGLRRAETVLLTALESHAYPDAARFALRLALEEAVVNGFKHGNKGVPTPRVDVGFRISDREVTIRICDHGPGFKPECVPDPTSPENIERPGGRGVMLMKAFMTRVEYNESGNQITMYYARP